MDDKGFTHLHLHTQYSLLDGAIQLEPLFGRCHEMGMTACAITDHGNMFGAVDFYITAMENNIKPIIGMEAYISPDSRFNKQKASIKDASYHLILLAENNKGYKNLMKLASIGYLEGFYYRPRIDKEILAELNEGLICFSACGKGEIPAMLMTGNEAGAIKAVEEYLAIFGKDRFFLEIQQHQGEDFAKLRAATLALGQKMGLSLVATNDTHFLNADDFEAHDVLTCISTGKSVNDPDRMRYPPDVYFKSPQEMRAMFSDVPSACDNTLIIADRCNVQLDLKSHHAPRYQPPKEFSGPEEYLTKLVYDGAKKRYGKITPQIKERIDRELEVIESRGFSSYFLIVWDLCNFAAKNNIPTGARGSGVGTVAGYCLGLCNVDPIKYGLLFERFMDPQRNEMPDIDIDICQTGRAQVIDYVRKKYVHVAQIITFGTLKAKNAIRDVCRALEIPLAESDRIAKLVPEQLNITLNEAIETEPELKKAYETIPHIHRAIDIAKRLEGVTRHASVHAAGVVIADEPLTNFLPLYKPPDSSDIMTQYEGPICDKVGMLKMDLLGLKNLSVIQRTIDLVESIHGQKIDIEGVDFCDPKVFAIFCSGKTRGIFQFESGGMQDLLMKLKPDRLEDLIAANALYRPGPMALIPDYIERKHGARWSVPHKTMHEILAETFGIMVYQEQVMRICNELGDIPLREAYTLIKAISKKKADIIAREKQRFVSGSAAKGLNEKTAGEIFELIERFAGYGFNKSHATRYSVIAYQTAYLKAYWPIEFMAAQLTFESGDNSKLADYIAESRSMGIEIRPPDINESFVDFTVVYDEQHNSGRNSGFIRFGLAAVKGVGVKAVEKIVEARQAVGRFHSLLHFCESVDLRAVNKQAIEALIKAGAFDRLGGSRAQMMAAVENAMKTGQMVAADRNAGQLGLFGHGNSYEELRKDHEKLPNVPPWSEMQMLQAEKEVLGLFVTSNPLSRHADEIGVYSNVNTSQLAERPDGYEAIIGGMISKIRQIVTKNGKNAGSKMAILTFDDLQGSVEVVMWSDVYAAFGHLVEVDRVVFVRGRIDCSRENPQIICNEIIPVEQASEKLSANVKIKFNENQITPELIAQIKTICSHHRGKSPLYVEVRHNGSRIKMQAGRELSVKPDTEFCKKMEMLLGPDNFELAR